MSQAQPDHGVKEHPSLLLVSDGSARSTYVIGRLEEEAVDFQVVEQQADSLEETVVPRLIETHELGRVRTYLGGYAIVNFFLPTHRRRRDDS